MFLVGLMQASEHGASLCSPTTIAPKALLYLSLVQSDLTLISKLCLADVYQEAISGA